MNTRQFIRRSLLTALAGACLIGMALAAPRALARPYSDINAAAKAGAASVHRLRGGISMLNGSGGTPPLSTAPPGVSSLRTRSATCSSPSATASRCAERERRDARPGPGCPPTNGFDA